MERKHGLVFQSRVEINGKFSLKEGLTIPLGTIRLHSLMRITKPVSLALHGLCHVIFGAQWLFIILVI